MPATLAVESSWRMVDGEHDSFDTSVVPLEDDLFLSSGQPSQESQESQESQDDDIQTFLRRAEDDDDDPRVLLRSPFQPSLPSSAYRTPEPEFHMPSVDVGVNHRGSPAQRDRPSSHCSNQTVLTAATATNATTKTTTITTAKTTTTTSSPKTTLRLPSVALFVAVLVGCGTLFGPGGPANSTARSIYAEAVVPTCSIPAVAWLNLDVCAPARTVAESRAGPALVENAIDNSTTHDDDRRTQVAAVVRDHVAASQASGGTTAQETWLLARARTKDLRLALQAAQSRRSTAAVMAPSSAVPPSTSTPLPSREALLLLELDEYLEAAKGVSLALARFQTGAGAMAADTLAHATRRTLVQLRRMGQTGKVGRIEGEGEMEGEESWLPRMLRLGSSGSSARKRSGSSSSRHALVEAYRRHANTLVTKTGCRVNEAEAVLTALEAAGMHLEAVQAVVAGRLDELTGVSRAEATGPDRDRDREADTDANVLWRLLGAMLRSAVGSATDKASRALQQWEEHAAQLQTVRERHDATVRQTSKVLDELASLRGTLQQLQGRFAGEDSRPDLGHLGLDLRLHMDIIEAGIEDLEMVYRG
ncbi:hypothetical protein CMQ_4449 [Grosmannia clavigera kw1407]|uniref:Uncharacterized protein n=1 Tax=Grosmannia clavigera (strain kw1407 / UAMH 11150) TaxID=655863 RepID=F0XU22_GROCL|nr:uncharacterized protein CMQ_4449 [Grosmannia clavigera kw1407]EFW98597.1 hypothetical protein CMQ_4449 [Grosmannia clavigera kw1407]